MPRQAGIPNRNKAFLLNRLKDMYGDDFDPILRMAENAQRIHDSALTASDDQIIMACKEAVNAWDKIAQYVQPKLKAVELSGEVNILDELTDKQLDAAIERLQEKE